MINELKLRNKVGKFAKQMMPVRWKTRPMTNYVNQLQEKGELPERIIFIEVGCALCDNAENILHKVKVNRLYLIDPYFDGDRRYEIAKAKTDFFPYMRLMRTTSEKASSTFRDNSFHAIYIDADHSYKSVKQDINLWYPKLKKGGVIGGHDFRGHAKGVILAVADWTKENDMRDKLQSGGVDWWIRK